MNNRIVKGISVAALSIALTACSGGTKADTIDVSDVPEGYNAELYECLVDTYNAAAQAVSGEIELDEAKSTINSICRNVESMLEDRDFREWESYQWVDVYSATMILNDSAINMTEENSVKLYETWLPDIKEQIDYMFSDEVNSELWDENVYSIAEKALESLHKYNEAEIDALRAGNEILQYQDQIADMAIEDSEKGRTQVLVAGLCYEAISAMSDYTTGYTTYDVEDDFRTALKIPAE